MRLETNRWTVASTIAGVTVALVFLMTGAWLLLRSTPTTGVGDELGADPTTGVDGDLLAAGTDASAAVEGSAGGGSEDGSPGVTLPRPGDRDPADRPDPGPRPGTRPDPDPPSPPKDPDPVPENRPPTIVDVAVAVSNGDVIVEVVTADPDANLALLEVASQSGSRSLTSRVLETAELEPGRDRLETRVDTGIDVGQVGRSTIEITVQVTDTDGARDDTQIRHEYVREVEVTVSPIVMTLDRRCFEHSSARSLSGQVVVAGTGIDTSAELAGEFRPGEHSLTVLGQQVGVVEGDKDWFVLVTLTPDLTSVGGGVTSLGKIQTLHNRATSGPIVKPFEVDGCRGSIAYAVDAQIVH